MNLIEITKIVKEKDIHRNKLLGQKEMLMKNLAELGFKKISTAETANEKLKNELTKMNQHYTKGKEKFQNDYSHLLI